MLPFAALGGEALTEKRTSTRLTGHDNNRHDHLRLADLSSKRRKRFSGPIPEPPYW